MNLQAISPMLEVFFTWTWKTYSQIMRSSGDLAIPFILGTWKRRSI